MAHALADRYDITVVTARLRRDLPQEEEMGKVKVVRVGTGGAIDKWLYPFLAARAAAKLRPDLIHAVLESFAGAALVRCKKTIPSAKRLLTCQSTNTKLLLKRIHDSADRVTAISTALIERAKQFGKKNVQLIPNGISLNEIDRERKRTAKVPGRILFVGRLEPMKGVDTLLRAFSAVLKRDKIDAFLYIVGDGSQKRTLTRLAKSLKLGDRCRFLGYIAPPEVFREFAEAEIFCGLSRSEALGNVFLEAQAAGCAVLATKTGGIPDIVKDGETGLLVKPDSVEKTTELLLQLLEDGQLRSHLGKAGIQNAKAYDWSEIAQKYGEVYEEMLR